MSEMVQINTPLIGNALVALCDTLQAAIFTSACAISSRTKEDLEHNSDLAFGHLEDVGRTLDGLRNDVSQKKGVTLAAKLKGQVREIDGAAFTEIMNLINSNIDICQEQLGEAIANEHRKGTASFLETIGRLGRWLLRAINLVLAKDVPLSPFYFDLVFVQAMETFAEEERVKKFWADRNKELRAISDNAGLGGLPSAFRRVEAAREN